MSTPVDADLLASEAEELSDTIEALDATRAPLWAVYGYNGTWEAERKALLDACALLARESLTEKATEAHIGQLAHAHETYKQRISLAVEERTTLALLDAVSASRTRRYELAKEKMANIRKMAGL